MIVKDGTTDFTHGIGTGPYRCKEFKPGVRSIARAQRRTTGSRASPISTRSSSSASRTRPRARQRAAGRRRRGRRRRRPALGRPHQGAAPGFAVFETKSGNYNDLIMRQDNAPAQQPRLRARHQVPARPRADADGDLLGYGVVGNDQPIDPSHRFYFTGPAAAAVRPGEGQVPPAQGRPRQHRVPLVRHGRQHHDSIRAWCCSRRAQQIGMNIDVQRMPADGYWSNVLDEAARSTSATSTRARAPTRCSRCSSSRTRPGTRRGWKNEKFDQLLVAARARDRRGQAQADVRRDAGA